MGQARPASPGRPIGGIATTVSGTRRTRAYPAHARCWLGLPGRSPAKLEVAMKRHDLTPNEREQILLEVSRRLLFQEISEGEALCLLRREVLGLSQEDYAKLVGISRRTLSDLERDQGNLTIAAINRVFRPLGLRAGLLPRQTELLKQATKES